jgi:hypothetical protein
LRQGDRDAVSIEAWIAFVFRNAVKPLRCAVRASRKRGVTDPWLPVELNRDGQLIDKTFRIISYKDPM